MRQRGFEVVSNKFRTTNTDIRLPECATSKSAGYDVFSPKNFILHPDSIQLVFTDVKAYMQDDEVLLLLPRSSQGAKGIMMANTVGVIDADYYNNANNDGNIGVMLYNYGSDDYVVNKGDKIGQLIFTKKLMADNGNTDKVRSGGMGSTGV